MGAGGSATPFRGLLCTGTAGNWAAGGFAVVDGLVGTAGNGLGVTRGAAARPGGAAAVAGADCRGRTGGRAACCFGSPGRAGRVRGCLGWAGIEGRAAGAASLSLCSCNRASSRSQRLRCHVQTQRARKITMTRSSKSGIPIIHTKCTLLKTQ